MSAEPKRITCNALFEAFLEAGVVRRGEFVRRLVLDMQVNEVPVLHVERWGDQRLLEVVRHLEGVEVREGRPAPIGYRYRPADGEELLLCPVDVEVVYPAEPAAEKG